MISSPSLSLRMEISFLDRDILCDYALSRRRLTRLNDGVLKMGEREL